MKQPVVDVREISPGVFHLGYSSRKKLAMSFLRFQEFYECPNFKGRYFTLAEYKKWYAERNGAFTYAEDWAGFNIPDYILTPFLQGKFDPLSDAEMDLLNIVKDLNLTEPFYLIGSVLNEGHTTILHEMAHAYWYLSPYYREEIKLLIKKIPEDFVSRFYADLLEIGYRKEVFEDEMQAYLITGCLLNPTDEMFDDSDGIVNEMRTLFSNEIDP